MRAAALVLALPLAACSFRASGAGDGGGGSSGDAKRVADVGVGGSDATTASGSDGGALGPCGSGEALPPSVNVDASPYVFATAPAWACDGSGTTQIDSSGAGTVLGACGGTPLWFDGVAQLAGGPPVLVVLLASLSVTGGHVLELTGDKPIVLLVDGDVVVDTGGVVEASASGVQPGPGGSRPDVCTDQAHGAALGPTDGIDWGGGGGGFGTAGGQGCFDTINGGFAVANQTLQPLRGGCGGMTDTATAAGAGGGAFEISARGTIAIGGTGAARLVASGGGALALAEGASTTGFGGGGGGAGGGILLAAPTAPAFGASGVARAHGGAGSEGIGKSGGTGAPGEDGHASDDNPATDTSGVAGGGNNNDHGRRGGLATLGTGGATIAVAGELGTAQQGGRGGGGGGGGLIVSTTAPPTCRATP